jgi:hypothetical protein
MLCSRNLLPPSSGWKSKSNMEKEWYGYTERGDEARALRKP